MNKENLLLAEVRDRLASKERSLLSPLACLSQEGIRRIQEEREGYRQPFAKDADRILHSKAYTRYIDKTQVFSLIDNDHITHRVLHVQLVSRIARTAGRFLGLNEDLIEAIALGHDIGHPLLVMRESISLIACAGIMAYLAFVITYSLFTSLIELNEREKDGTSAFRC